MATQEQFQAMIEMMQQQMARLDAPQRENEALHSQNAHNQSDTNLKQPDRPVIEGNLV